MGMLEEDLLARANEKRIIIKKSFEIKINGEVYTQDQLH